MKTKNAVILAAGLGSRLDAPEGHKLLAVIGTQSLLQHHLDGFSAMGVQKVIIVSGYKAEDLNKAVLSYESELEIEVVINTDYEKSNGLSVLSGSSLIPGENFWLTMGDHFFVPGFYPHLATFDPAENIRGMLVVDEKLDTIYDMPDATKVRLNREKKLDAISKEIDPFDLVDCGMFWVTPDFLSALKTALGKKGDCSTSDAVKGLCAGGQFEFWDIGAHLWQDVDTPGAREHAEKINANKN